MLKSGPPMPVMDRRWKPTVEMAPNCPRCNSSCTKFCYYNNYSLTQPRYFCKSCRRYWTKGGSLRNVPIGGSCRKNRRGKSARAIGSLSPGCSLPNSNRSARKPIGNCGQSERENLSEDNNGPNIDLAVVYAKYLNQDNAFHSEQDSGFLVLEIPNQLESSFDLSTSENQFLHQNNTVQCGDFPSFDPQIENYIGEANQIFLGGLEANQSQDGQQRIGQAMSSDLSNFGFQPFPNDGVLQDVFMSNLSCSSSSSWQLPQQPFLEGEIPAIYPNFSDLF